MTDPTGRSFISYRRSRIAEAALLITAQRARGIPTWQDVTNLGAVPTEAAIRAVLVDPTTADALLWLTPEVESSTVIREVEVPLIAKRVARQDGFFAVTAAAGGLDYDSAALAAGNPDVAYWNCVRRSTIP